MCSCGAGPMPAEHHLPECDRFRHNSPLIARAEAAEESRDGWKRGYEAKEARVAELEALLREAYEEDHRGHHGPVGDLGERIFDALGDAPVEPEPPKDWRCETCDVPAVPAPGHTCWDAGHPHVVVQDGMKGDEAK